MKIKIEQSFQNGLVELLKTKPLEEINVIMLCDYISSNRQTFYYHFRDISDVVDSIFLKANVGYGKRLLDYDVVLKEMFSYISAHSHFISEINKSYAADKLHQFMFTYFYLKITNILKNHSCGVDIARYMATLSSHEITLWISNKRKERSSSVSKRLNTIWHYFVNQYKSDFERLSKEL